MKKYITDIKTLAALLMAGAAMTACSSDDNIVSDAQQPVNPTGHYTMTVNATMGDNGTNGSNRALALDGTALKVKWAGTDQVAVFPEDWSWTPLGMLTAAASETGSTTLTGDLTGPVAVSDNLHLLFPRAEWSYTGQKGILLSDENSIEKKYDYALADVEVAAIDNSHITTTANANLTSQQAIVKFILKNKEGGAALAAENLTISAASNKLVTKKGYRGTGEKSYYNGSGYYTVDGGSGGFGGEQHENLVDNKEGTKWCTDGSGWYIEFHTASPILVDGYMLRTAGDTGSEPGRNPKDWVLKGKNEGDPTWTTIDTKSNNHDMPAASNTPQDFDADAPGTYQYFRLEITANQSGGIMQLAEMQLFKYASYEMGTSYGDITVTPDAATSEYTVALRNENAGTDTYTLTATVGEDIYTFEKSGVTFENGKYYNITVKMERQTTIDLSTVTTDITVPDGFTLTGTLDGAHKISIADGAMVTLDGVTINGVHSDSYLYAGITCLGDATIILKDGTTNTVNGNDAGYPGIQAGGEDKTLTITGTGSLSASSDGTGAGIGSVRFQTCGNIVISGGTITAVGGQYRGAGIGSGYNGVCGTITISGGTITATGGRDGAGIGSGNEGNCGNITITSGVTSVTATKGSNAPNSIGAGLNATCGTVKFGDQTMYNGSSWTTTPTSGSTYDGLNLTISRTKYDADTWTLTPVLP